MTARWLQAAGYGLQEQRTAINFEHLDLPTKNPPEACSPKPGAVQAINVANMRNAASVRQKSEKCRTLLK